MDRDRGFEFERRTLLRTLGTGGGLYGLTTTTGAAGTTRPISSGVPADPSDDFDTFPPSKITSTLTEILRDHVFDPLWESIIDFDSWSDGISQLRTLLGYIGPEFSGAIETALDKADVLLQYSSEIETILGETISDLRDDDDDEEESSSNGRIVTVSGAGASGVEPAASAGETGARASAVTLSHNRIDDLASDVKDLADDLTDLYDDLTSGIPGFGDLWDSVEDFTDDITGGVKGFVKDAAETVADALLASLDLITDQFAAFTDASDSFPAFDISFDSFPGFDFAASVGSPIDSVDPDAKPDLDAFGNGSSVPSLSSRSAGGSVTNTDVALPTARTRQSAVGLPGLEPQPIQMKDCEKAKSGEVTAIPYRIGFEDPITDSGFYYDLFLGFERWYPCLYGGVDENLELTVDFTTVAEWVGWSQSAWAAIGEAAKGDTQARIEGLEAAETVGEYADEAEELKDWITDFERYVSPYDIELRYLLDRIDDIDLSEIEDDVERLESATADLVGTLEAFGVDQLLVEFAEVVTAVDLNEDIPEVEEIAETAGEMASKQAEDIEVRLPSRLAEQSTAARSALEDMDDYEEAQLEEAIDQQDVPFTLDDVKAGLELLEDGELSKAEVIDSIYERLTEKTLENLKDELDELTEVGYDFGDHTPEFGCTGKCVSRSSVKAVLESALSNLYSVLIAITDVIEDVLEILLPDPIYDAIPGRPIALPIAALMVIGIAKSKLAAFSILGGAAGGGGGSVFGPGGTVLGAVGGITAGFILSLYSLSVIDVLIPQLDHQENRQLA